MSNNIFEYINQIDKQYKPKPPVMQKFIDSNVKIVEIGVDEVGRGPLFGRVYAAAVALPKKTKFDHSRLKDSKQFKSFKKLEEEAQYIKENALAWGISYLDEKSIDEINILQATQQAMHDAISKVIEQLNMDFQNIILLIDGNYFNPIPGLKHITVPKGDSSFSSIAAASIIAKVERDNYVKKMCELYPLLDERYKLSSNKGYGSQAHRNGITQFGLSPWHRQTFGICKQMTVQWDDEDEEQLTNVTS